MSLYVVEREADTWLRDANDLWRQAFGWPPIFRGPLVVPELVDCNAHDGEWPAFIGLAHETVEWEGMAVPAFEGDVERKAWEERRRSRR